MTWAVRGLIEGFYGRPWTWDERLTVLQACAAGGMSHYVYAPKDDPRHRERWREPYDDAELDGFSRLVEHSGLSVGFGISPGLDVDPRHDDDRLALARKVDSVVERGVSLVVLALDDLPPDPRGAAAQGADHGQLTAWLTEHLRGRATVALVPTDYVGTEPSPYLDALAPAVPEGVMIGWTGRFVVNGSITAAEADRRAAAVGGRRPLLWDNYPVNDGFMEDRMFLGPLQGRDPGLADACDGYLANALVQPRSSILPLASVAGYLRGEDPVEAWRAAAGAQRVFAEACDGSVPYRLASRLVEVAATPAWHHAARPLARWLAAAERCEAPGLEGEADEWLTQVHREARVGLGAVRVLAALRPYATIDADGHGRVVRPDSDAVLAETFALTARWPRVRRSERTVLGPRASFSPVLDQWPNGQWRFHPGALEADRNATDLLAHAAITALDSAPAPAEAAERAEVTVDGAAVPVDDDDSFTSPPGAVVLVRIGRHRTLVQGPAPPLGGAG